MFMEWKSQYIKISTHPILIYRFNTISIKIPAGLSVGTGNLILNCLWESRESKELKSFSRTKMKDSH